jgi:hypothetical protein
MDPKIPVCQHMQTCEMYQLMQYAGTLAAWKIRYCTADFTQCARYRRAQAGKPVPKNLMPNGALLRRADEARE